MLVDFYKNSSDKMVVNKIIVKSVSVNAEFKESVSIIRPTLIITRNDLVLNSNYIYVPLLKRYYYIEDVTFLNNNILELKCKVDLLMSFKTEFLELECILKRNEFLFDTYLIDDEFIVQNKTQKQIKKFNKSFSTNLSYILTVAGGN